MAAPRPLSISPSQSWEGDDGPWSTFLVGIGTPLQYLHMLISFIVNLPWVVLPEGCPSSASSTCPSDRGELFYRNMSSTWRNQGTYTLEYESNLGYFDDGFLGYDTLSTGLPGTTAVTLEDQIIAGIAADNIFLNLWGLGPRPTNLSSFDNPYPSMVESLKKKGLIPSISYGYTAGARYQLKKVAGSLTLGGYDASRFVPNDSSFSFAGDTARDLVVGLQKITINGLTIPGSPGTTSLLPDPILSFIDAGVSQIWLPAAACELFSKTLGLQYDPVTKLYLVNDTVHETLINQNLTFTFKIAEDVSSVNTVSIEFPYAAFDLILTTSYPGINTTTHYFPIRQAENDTQYTLGRAFLQQAYIVADYERSKFSVYPCVFSENEQQDLRGIPPVSETSVSGSGNRTTNELSHSGQSFLPGVIAAIAIGSVVVGILLLVGAFMIGRRGGSISCRSLRSKTFEKVQEQPWKQHSSKRLKGLVEQEIEVEGDLYHRGELKGETRHSSELTEDLQCPQELRPNCDIRPELARPRTAGVEDQQDVLQYELDANTFFSYAQTPLSKIGVDDVLKENDNSLQKS